jgi:hypothetical protein
MSEIPEKTNKKNYIGSGLPGGWGEDHIRINDYSGNDGYSLTGNPNFTSDVINFATNPTPAAMEFEKKFSESQSFNLNSNTFTLKSEPQLVNNSKNNLWKYSEDKTLKEIEEYLVSTYKSHYTSETSKTQTLDLIESIGDAEPFVRSNAIKYLSRFGKKNGKSKMDILKAIHYCILLYHFSGLHNETAKSNYETF